VTLRFLLLSILFPTLAFAWTLNDRCEVTRETPKGTVAVARAPNGILFYLPDGLVPNDSWVKVGIGNRSWIARVIGGAVELEGGLKPFLETNWMTVHLNRDYLLGFNLLGSSAAWEQLQACEPPPGKGPWETLSGEITASSDDEVIAAIRHLRPEGLVLNSPGGLAEEAQRIGYAVRKARMATKVEADGECLSECAFILAAGAPRTVAAGARVGVRPSLVTGGLGVLLGEQGTIAATAVYFDAMGVNGGRLAVLAATARSDDIRPLTPAELHEVGLVDTKGPVSRAGILATGASGSDAGGWWWLVPLGAIPLSLWGAARLWSRG
jgi:ATP-dependent protease ClpP protease subunit